MIGDKQCNFVALYRSPSQNQNELDYFPKRLEMLALKNPFALVAIGNLNAKSKNLYPLDRITYETITSHFGLHQLPIV